MTPERQAYANKRIASLQNKLKSLEFAGLSVNCYADRERIRKAKNSCKQAIRRWERELEFAK